MRDINYSDVYGLNAKSCCFKLISLVGVSWARMIVKEKIRMIGQSKRRPNLAKDKIAKKILFLTIALIPNYVQPKNPTASVKLNSCISNVR